MKYIIFFILVAVLCLLVQINWYLYDARADAQAKSAKLDAILNSTMLSTANVRYISEQSKLLVSPERIKSINNDLDVQVEATQLLTNSYRQIADSTTETLEKHLNPAIDQNAEKAGKAIDSIVLTATKLQNASEELEHQIKQNGDSSKVVLDKAGALIAHSDEELRPLLAELTKTTEHIRLVVDDPHLVDLIKQIDLTGQNIEVITGNLSDLSDTVIKPITHPPKPKNSFDKYIVRPTFKLLRIANGAGNFFYILERLR